MAAGVLAWHLSGGDAIPRGNAGGEQAWGGTSNPDGAVELRCTSNIQVEMLPTHM